MSIIVRDKNEGNYYLLIGSGYGAYKSSRPSFVGGDLFPSEDEGSYEMMAVSDEVGNIHWFNSKDIEVVEIDGISIRDALEKYINRRKEELEKLRSEGFSQRCPACGDRVSINASKCPSCGIRFIDE